MRRFALFALLALAGTTPVLAETVASVESPGKILRVDLDVTEGRLSYRISRLGETVIAPSHMGFLLRGAGKLERNLALASSSTRSQDDTWEQPWGESRFVRDHYDELRTRFTETIEPKRSIDVVFRVFDDGVGFRYEFPDQPQLHDVIIDDELTEFDVASPATAWWIPAGEWNRYEYLYNKTPLAEVGQAHTPMTIKTRDGLYIAFHEAALVDYSSMWLRRVEGQRLRAQLAPASEGWKVHRTAPFNTPWRTLQIADTAGGLYESNLILNLNEPNKLGDVSWFKPSKFVGVWWSLHLDQQTWATGPKHGATTATTKRYIDFAAKHGFRGVLVEGWNPGWDGNWFGNGWNFDFTRATPDFDIEQLAAYAKSKGVHLIGHHETGCAVSHYESQLDAAFALDQRLGIDAVKTGYVCDAGQIERQDVPNGPVVREWHDGQWMARHHLKVVQAAAAHHIVIDTHEPIKDTGLRRTYPNWVAREGARGMEYNAWGNPPNPPEHEANLVFTRMLAGPMDFTPGVLSLKGRNGQPIQSTIAKQLALYVVLYSPIQMAADLPENYEKHMDAFQFIEDVPVDWSQTRVLDGEIGDYVTIARKDRNGEGWYLGSVTDENGRVLSVPLSFLDPGRTYVAQIYRDGDGAHWKTAPFAFARETKRVTSADTLTLRLAPGGGEAIRFMPVGR
ncbi:glycoside hydrolase family 97 protein [Cognatiluteimonas profundi]|uniref:glycoside hydrolase family 97 protein n=1 Tax=Cognatiluteimonas profundi TaxID=2594501 RepID=UPI001E4EAF6A|nr:glycoside hydrolase family 97 protein [Lysobacter profundi]